jgi:hypothetical protein
LDLPPRELLSWKNRFDHPDKTLRTLYCAEKRQTAFREVLADFRPNTKARSEYRDLYGEDLPAPRITRAWRATKALAQGTLKILRGDLVDIDDQPCAALFEGRSLLVPIEGSEPEPLTSTHPDLVTICNELGLVLEG